MAFYVNCTTSICAFHLEEQKRNLVGTRALDDGRQCSFDHGLALFGYHQLENKLHNDQCNLISFNNFDTTWFFISLRARVIKFNVVKCHQINATSSFPMNSMTHMYIIIIVRIYFGSLRRSNIKKPRNIEKIFVRAQVFPDNFEPLI